MKKAIIFLAYILILDLWSCQKITNTEPLLIDPATKTTKDLVIPTTFSFETSKAVSVGILHFIGGSSVNLPQLSWNF